MPYPQFDRFAVRMEPLSARDSKKHIEKDHISPDMSAPEISQMAREIILSRMSRSRKDRAGHRPPPARNSRKGQKGKSVPLQTRARSGAVVEAPGSVSSIRSPVPLFRRRTGIAESRHFDKARRKPALPD